LGTQADVTALDYALAMANIGRALPSYRHLQERCMPASGLAVSAATLAACRAIYGRLADGETILERMLATQGMVRLTVDRPEAPAWRERYRRLRWTYEQFGEGELHAHLRGEDYALNEAAAMQDAVEAAGRWPPPADWLPDDPRARSLILTGRPPPQSGR
jgi:hypothetical protein